MAHSDHTLGFKITDELFKKVREAIFQKRINEIIYLRTQGKQLLKMAFNNQNSELYAYVIKKTADVCLEASNGQYFEAIAILLGLEEREARIFFCHLDKKKMEAFTFELLNNIELERFSEELNKNKNTIAPFKQQIYKILASHNLDCRIDSAQLTAIQKSLQNDFPKLLVSRDSLMLFDYLGSLVFNNGMLFDHLFIHDQPEAFAKLLHSLLMPIFTVGSNPTLQRELFQIVEVKYEDIEELLTLLTPEMQRLIFVGGAMDVLGRIARANNVPIERLNAFTEAVFEAISKLVGASLFRDTGKILEELNAAVRTKNIQEGILLRNELELILQNHFRRREEKHFSALLMQITRHILSCYALGDLTTLQQIGDFSRVEIKEVEFLLKNRREDLMAEFLLESLELDTYVAPNFNCSLELARVFKRNVLTEIAPNTLEPSRDGFLAREAKLWLENEVTRLSLAEIRYETMIRLKKAFEFNNTKQFAETLKNMVGFVQMALQNNQIEKLMLLLNLRPYQVSSFFDPLRSGDFQAFAKIMIDTVLQYFIKQGHGNLLSYDNEFYKTHARRVKVQHEREKQYLEFQKVIYQMLDIPVTEGNLGPILVSQSKLQTSLTRTSKIRDDLKQCFQDNVYNAKLVENVVKTTEEYLSFETNFQNFLSTYFKQCEHNLKLASDPVQIIEQYLPTDLILQSARMPEENVEFSRYVTEMRAYLQRCFKENQYQVFGRVISEIVGVMEQLYRDRMVDKIAILSHLLTLGFMESKSWYKRDITTGTLQFINKLLADLPNPQSVALLNFTLVDLFDYQFFADFDRQYLEKIIIFKKNVLEILNKSLELEFFPEKAVREYIAVYQKDSMEVQCLRSVELSAYARNLTLQTQIAGKTQRKAQSQLMAFMCEQVKAMQALQSSGNLDRDRGLFTLSPFACKRVQALLNPENQAFLFWLLLNDAELTGLEQYAKENGLTQEVLYQLKSILYTRFSDKLGREELLDNIKRIQERVDSSLNKREIDTIKLIGFEIEALLKDSFQSGNHKEFSEILLNLVQLLKRYLDNPKMITQLLTTRGESLRRLFMLLASNQEGLLIRHLIECFEVSRWSYHFNIPMTNAQQFFKGIFEHLNQIVRVPLLSDPDKLLKESRSILFEAMPSTLDLDRISLEADYLLQDAFQTENSQIFSKTIQNMVSMLETLYKANKNRLIIQIMELDSEEVDREILHSMHNVFYASQKLQLEKVFQTLVANDLTGLTRLLIDYYIGRFRSKTFGSVVDQKVFKSKIYQDLHVIPLDLYDPLLIDLEQEKGFLALSLRTLANQGADLTRYEVNIERLAKTKAINEALLVPEASDTPMYRALYAKMKKIWIEHLVGHRFGVTGEYLEGSYSVTMAKELQDAFSHFSATTQSGYGESFEAAKKIAFSSMSETQWKVVVSGITQDVNAILLKVETPELLKRLNDGKTVAIPLFLNSALHEENGWGHLTAALFFQYQSEAFCLLSDRSEVLGDNHCGIKLFKINKPENIQTGAQRLLRSNGSYFTVQHYKEVCESLSLTEVFNIAKKPQKSGNCGWSSSAKMLFFSIVFVNFLNKVVGLKSQKEAFEVAANATHPVYKAFTNFDRVHCLKNYLELCQTTMTEPHVRMLAQIFLKSEHKPSRKEVVSLLESRKLVTEKAKQEAYGDLLKTTSSFILATAKFQSCLLVDSILLEHHAKRLLEVYLSHRNEKIVHDTLQGAVKALRDRHPELIQVMPVSLEMTARLNRVRQALFALGSVVDNSIPVTPEEAILHRYANNTLPIISDYLSDKNEAETIIIRLLT